jgi:guanylate kinase
MQTKNIYLLVGESGNGKTSVAEELEKQYGWKSIWSYTTRPKRYDGEAGHVFITENEFDKLTNLVAYTKFNDYRYGTTSDQVEQNSLYVIDPAGIAYFKEHYYGFKKVFVIYLFAPMKERILRMRNRGDIDAQIVQRLLNDVDAFRGVKWLSDITIINDNLKDCVDSCYQYILSKEMSNEVSESFM